MTMDGRNTNLDSASGDGSGTSEEPRYTKADLDKARSDALAAAGRDVLKIGEQRAEVERTLAEARRLQDEAKEARRKAEVDFVKDDPDALSAVRQRHKVEDLTQQAEHERTEALRYRQEADTMKQEALRIKAQARADALSADLGVDADVLMMLAGDNTEKLEALAKLLPKSGDRQPQLPGNASPRLRHHSSTSNTGSRGRVTYGDLREYNTQGKSHEEKKEDLNRILDSFYGK